MSRQQKTENRELDDDKTRSFIPPRSQTRSRLRHRCFLRPPRFSLQVQVSINDTVNGDSLPTWRRRLVRTGLFVALQLPLQLADASLLFDATHGLVLLGFAGAAGAAGLRSSGLGRLGRFAAAGRVLVHELVELVEDLVGQLVDVEFELVVLDAL